MNATFPEVNGTLPTNCQMNLLWDNQIITRESNDTHILFDTYQLGKNATISIGFSGLYESGGELMSSVENVTVNNFFVPKVKLLMPTGGEDWCSGTHRITWHTTDANADDGFLFRIRFSNDGGCFWQILSTGLMNYDKGNGWYYYDWTTTSLLETTNGLVEVTAYDNDTTFGGHVLPSLPPKLTDPIWPALSSSDVSDSVFAYGSAYIGGIIECDYYTETIVSTPKDYVVVPGTSGEFLSWMIDSAFLVYYEVYRDGTHIQSGNIMRGEIAVPIAGLSEGEYVFEIRVYNPDDDGWEVDSVTVNILPQQNLLLPMSSLNLILRIGLTCAFSLLAGVPSTFALLAIRAWKRKEGYWAEPVLEYEPFSIFLEIFSDELASVGIRTGFQN
ncbi:MAG: hypothetical protein ACXADC_09780 [Candidatus Thorarchaeota archaeon]